MTKHLEEALSRLSELPEEMQDLIAELILAEIECERKWDGSFAASQDELARLANQAFDEFQQGDTRPCE